MIYTHYSSNFCKISRMKWIQFKTKVLRLNYDMVSRQKIEKGLMEWIQARVQKEARRKNCKYFNYKNKKKIEQRKIKFVTF
jgi:hypothetical protein